MTQEIMRSKSAQCNTKGSPNSLKAMTFPLPKMSSKMFFGVVFMLYFRHEAFKKMLAKEIWRARFYFADRPVGKIIGRSSHATHVTQA